MKKYDNYKDSGIEWIGNIPENWSCTKLKYHTRKIIDGAHFTPTYIENVENAVPFLRVTDLHSQEIDFNNVKFIPQEEHKELIKRCYPEKGDLLLSKNGTIGLMKIVDWEWEFSIFVSLCLLKFEKTLENRFFKFFFDSNVVDRQLFESSQKTSVTNLHLEKIKELRLTLPPIEEQITIANYLDQKTTQIDDLIAKKERLIQLLEEERTAIINQAVTKGLDPTVPMKDSGIEWLGEIPAHWEVKRIGHVAKVVRGASPRPAGDPLLFNGDFLPWITVKEVTNAEGKFIVSTETYLTEQGSKNTRIIEPETLLLSNSGATLGVPRITKIKGGINDGSVAFFNLQIERDYLYYFFITHTKIYRDEVSGYGQPNLNTDIIKSTKIALPNKKEQLEIVLFIENYLEKFEFLKYKTQQEIELLKEYKTALISEVVTGKVDVREEKIN
ncbi:restriction endonuclease subunit S [uncultured Flavobacterium sp.]|uniref:restriction endonuclease subunit S n=1 Tax=uncultured Flavobacterium sp. TaxID=165435 RepID=UPI00261C8316|nr:restriction endonuclease subunit S [uncultured Flavobacterium sp.]